jgi:hypothetical protein
MIRWESHSAVAIQCFLAACCIGIGLAIGFTIFLQQQKSSRYPQQVDVVYIAFGGGAFGVLCCFIFGIVLFCKTGSCFGSVKRYGYAVPVSSF